jgi:hypothetical protein
MKTILGMLCLLFAYLAAPCQSTKDIKKNKVKSLTIWQTPKDDGQEAPVKESFEAFDKNGNTIQKIEYKPDGSIDKKETARYDKNQNKVEEFTYDGSNQVTSHKTYLYDRFQNKIEENEFLPSGELGKKTNATFNAGGDKLSETVTDAKGNILKIVEYRYNTHNLKVQKITSNKAKQVESVRKWGYEYY